MQLTRTIKLNPLAGKYRPVMAITAAAVITAVTIISIGKPVKPSTLALIGLSRFVYCLILWYLYFLVARIRLRYKIAAFGTYLILSIILAVPLVFFSVWVNSATGIFYPPFVQDPSTIKNVWAFYTHFYLIRAVAMSIIIFLVQYREDLLSEKHRMQLANEQLQQQNVKMQLEALRQGVDPHFLFNTLNSLKTLIRSNPAQAEKYTDELSDVYRYLLHHHKRDTVTLSEELNFLRSYLSLMQIRFADNFTTSINADRQFLQYHILPLSLQVLVENAVKHNIISSDKPLQVHIFVAGDKEIVVQNNVQPRISTQGSSQFGLYHLGEQYRLVTGKEISINKTAQWFSVHLPLIPNHAL